MCAQNFEIAGDRQHHGHPGEDLARPAENPAE